MTWLVTFIAGRLGVSKALLESALVLAVAAAAAWGVHVYNQSIRDALVAQQEAAIIATQQRMQKQSDAAVSAAVDAEKVRAAQNVQIKEIIRRVPVTTACAASPAVAAVLARVRDTAGGASGTSGAGGAAALRR